MKPSEDMIPAFVASYPKQSTDNTLYNQALSLLLREKCSRFTVAFALVTTIALLNCWWFLSGNVRFDIPYSSEGDHTSSIYMHDRPDASHDRPTSSAPLTGETCDYSRGSWVPDTRPPLYTSKTCRYIHRSQDCIKNGRPDKGFLNWRWQPTSCDLPYFDAQLFLKFMNNKTMMFIGDSIARNHMQSLLCALSQVEDPKNVYFDVKEKEATWRFSSYSFTLGNKWSPFLVNHTFEQNIYHIHLDVPDIMWSTTLADYDVVVISTGYWYFRSNIYYMDNRILGANPHSGLNFTTFDKLPAMKIAWRTVLDYMLKEFKGITIARTITVPHFDTGSWSNGGACNKTQPTLDPLMQEPLPWMSHAITQIQYEEFTKAMEHMQINKKSSQRLKILNITYSSFLRPDGHPGAYRLQTAHEPRNDCLHWCLPGPIDTWNQILSQMLYTNASKQRT